MHVLQNVGNGQCKVRLASDFLIFDKFSERDHRITLHMIMNSIFSTVTSPDKILQNLKRSKMQYLYKGVMID